MRRRNFIAAAAGAALFPVSPALPQAPSKLPRVGILSSIPRSDTRTSQVFLDELRSFGWVEGQTVVIDWKVAAGRIEQFDELAAELVRAAVDVIVAPNPNAVFAARRATSSIPIVMVNTPDPVQLGIVASLSRPGTNVTGTCSLSAEVSAKQVQLMKDFLPGLTRLVVLTVPTSPWHPYAVAAIEASARSLQIVADRAILRDPADVEAIFADIARGRGQAALILTDPITYFHRTRLAEAAMRHRVPAAYGLREYAEAGGLMSYWAHHETLYRRTAAYVDRLLKGEKVENLPIEQPTKYELVINLRTANALGIEVPPALLARADEVIE